MFLTLALLPLFLQTAGSSSNSRNLRVSSIYPSFGSSRGGTRVVISGSGFQYPTEGWNPWDQINVQMGAYPCNILAHYSNSTNIVCETTSLPEETYFETVSVIVFQYSLLGVAEIQKLSGATDAFQYRRDDTAFVYAATEWGGTAGDFIRFHATSTNGDDGITTSAQFSISFGEEGSSKCAINVDEDDGYPDEDIVREQQTNILCQISGDDFVLPGFYNLTVRVNSMDPTSESCVNALCFPPDATVRSSNHGLGHGVVAPASSVAPWMPPYGPYQDRFWGTVLLESGLAYHVVIYPQITSVSPASGGLHGGNHLTIRGTAFSPEMSDNTVTVGGIPCTVTSASVHELVCTLADSTTHDMTSRRRSMRGLLFEDFWSSVSITEFDQDGRNDPYKHGIKATKLDWYGSPSTEESYRASPQYTTHVSVGFFVPPLTANYQFFLACDDSCSIDLSLDESRENMETQASSTSYSTFSFSAAYNPSLFYEKWSTVNARSLPTEVNQTTIPGISSPMTLEAGRRYAFRHVLVNGGGAGWSRVALKVFQTRFFVMCRVVS